MAIAFCLSILAFDRRKKRKAAQLRSHGQRALARDVEGFRARLGRGWPAVVNAGPITREERDDGLDERGEAPPPYVPGSKPPSIGVESTPRTSSGHRAGGDVELDDLTLRRGAVNDPPGYHEHEHTGSEVDLGVVRPQVAVAAPERLSTRSLRSHTVNST